VAAWGTEPVALVPDTTPTNGRSNFFIHGGVAPGSAGCIDLGPNEKAYFDALRSTGEPSHEVVVGYDPSLETAPHPLAGSHFWKDVSEYITRPLPGLASPSLKGTPPATPAFQPDAVYSPDGNFIGNFPTDSAATSLRGAANASGRGLGSQVAEELSAPEKSGVPVLTRVGKYIGDSLITPAGRVSPSGPPLRDPTAPNLPGDETLGIISDKPERRLGRRIVNPSPASASQATVPAMPFVPSNEGLSPDDRAFFSDRFGNWTSSGGITQRNPSLPVPSPDPDRPLGIFSGKPMPLWTTPPPLGGLLDNSNAAGNNGRNWFTALAGNSFSPTGGSGDTRSSPTPEPQQSQGPALPYIQEYLQYLNQMNGNNPRASVFDTGMPAAPFDVFDPTPFSGGLPGRLAAVAGIDPQNSNQFAPPPLDDEQGQADLRALDARLSNSGDIRDAVARCTTPASPAGARGRFLSAVIRDRLTSHRFNTSAQISRRDRCSSSAANAILDRGWAGAAGNPEQRRRRLRTDPENRARHCPP
jgi:hypothetical protein